ncbi:MAG: hypothetical protein IH951_03155 [Bacteroidetes bacterium]|nr:hypothetical protein [Bacteroidota bacterium]
MNWDFIITETFSPGPRIDHVNASFTHYHNEMLSVWHAYRKVHTLFALVFLMPLASGCGGSVGSGTIDDIEIGKLLRLDLENILEMEGVFERDRVDQVQALFSEPPPGLERLRIYSATAEVDEEGRMDLRIAMLSQPAGMDEAFLAIAVGSDGVLYRSRLWGIPDPESAWENYWRQYQFPPIRTVINLSSAPSDSLAEHIWMRLQSDSSAEGQTLRALYRIQMLMRSNSYLIRRTMAVTGNGEVPEPEWYLESKDNFAELGRIADALRPVIGESAAKQFTDATDESKALFEPLVSHARNHDAGKLRRAVMDFRRHTCVACHGIEDHLLGEGNLNRALISRLSALGVRKDIYRVGYDIWPVPGEEQKSQEIASTIKAMLILLGG